MATESSTSDSTVRETIAAASDSIPDITKRFLHDIAYSSLAFGGVLYLLDPRFDPLVLLTLTLAGATICVSAALLGGLVTDRAKRAVFQAGDGE